MVVIGWPHYRTPARLRNACPIGGHDDRVTHTHTLAAYYTIEAYPWVVLAKVDHSIVA